MSPRLSTGRNGGQGPVHAEATATRRPAGPASALRGAGRLGDGEHPAITLHASAVALAGRGLMITGQSGAGKSTLAAEMIALGATLVADDRVVVERIAGGPPTLHAPHATAGLLELRGIGIVRLEHVAGTVLCCIVDLDRPATERMPHLQRRDLLGQPCPVIFGARRPGLAAALAVVLHAGGVIDPDGDTTTP